MEKNKINDLIKEATPATIVAATKYIDQNKMRELFSYGINNFGENRVDAFLEKYESLKDLNITWHFIGHLQRNKAKEVINKIDYLHSLDSLKLANMINELRDKPLKVFIEVKLVENNEKSGVTLDELDNFVISLKQYKNIDVIGLMVMTNKDQNPQQKQDIFHKARMLANKYNYKELSMGMSDDYKLALMENSSFIRLGRVLFDSEDMLK